MQYIPILILLIIIIILCSSVIYIKYYSREELFDYNKIFNEITDNAYFKKKLEDIEEKLQDLEKKIGKENMEISKNNVLIEDLDK